jgi:hypothetical protein
MIIKYSAATNGFYCEHNSFVPKDAVEISEDLHAELLEQSSKGFEITSDKSCYPIAVEIQQTQDQKAVSQYQAIDDYVTQCITSRGYDHLTEVNLAAAKSEEFKIEALAIQNWVMTVWIIQDAIKSSVLDFDSIDDAIAALPVFEILS